MARRITNKNNLPETIVQACTVDTHKTIPGGISVSQLIDGPRIRLLKKMYDYEEDVSEMLYALLGTSLHAIIERANMGEIRKRAFTLVEETLLSAAEELDHPEDTKKKDGFINAAKWLNKTGKERFLTKSDFITEQTLSMEIDGHLIYGTPDLYQISTKTLYDYKMCSTYAWTNEQSRRKWKAQTNIYATLLENAGYPVEKIKIIPFFRDWSATGVIKNKDYPPFQICEMPMDLNPREDEGNLKGRMSFIRQRLKLHMDAEKSEVLPLCSGTDRWASADTWAVKMKGGKKALKIGSSEKEIKSWIEESRFKGTIKEYDIEFRPGVSVRCEKYCPVAAHCEQFKKIKEIQMKNSDKE